MKILTILGARPQFIKAATVSRAIAEKNITHAAIQEVIVHTGQHFDTNMSDVFFDELEIPKPHYRLECGGVRHGCMTGKMLESIEKIILTEKPSWVLVYGDTNSTLAGALAASKLHIPVAHVEAGLRSFNMAMPEEVNRVLTDRVSNYLFCPTETAVENLNKEGFPYPSHTKEAQKVFQVGDVMYDSTLFYRERAKEHVSLNRWNVEDSKYALCTIHRAENTDNPSRLEAIFHALNQINVKLPIIFPIHPRTKKIIEKSSFANLLTNLIIVEPLSYLEIQRLEMGAKAILTDSGGMQKEAFFHKVPCITLRDETEWTETVELGCNVLVGAEKGKIVEAFEDNPLSNCKFESSPYGSGDSATLCLEHMLAFS
jgi:UDP-GlcNAc3NAcA epimerase